MDSFSERDRPPPDKPGGKWIWVPDGWRAVPAAPTPEMVESAYWDAPGEEAAPIPPAKETR